MNNSGVALSSNESTKSRRTLLDKLLFGEASANSITIGGAINPSDHGADNPLPFAVQQTLMVIELIIPLVLMIH